LVLTSGLLFGSAAQAAVFVSNGFQAGSYVRDCRSSSSLTSPDKCIEGNGPSFVGTIVEATNVAYPGATTASSTTTSSLARTSGTNVTGGSIQALGENPPIVKLAAFTSTNYARVSTGVTSVQGWSWDGTGDANRTIDLNLTFTGTYIGEFGTEDFNPGSELVGTLAVFSLDTLLFEVDEGIGSWNPSTNPGAPCSIGGSLLDCLASKRTDYSQIALASFDTSSPTTGVSFALTSGRYYFTYLYAAAFARHGAYIDARNTVVARWDDVTGLTAAPGSTVPEPGTLALLGLGLAGLGFSRRRKA